MPIDERWNKLSPVQWDAFAKAWLTELRLDSERRIGQSVVQMNFTAADELQWKFIQTAMQYAESEDELGHIAAGPVEHLLCTHGEKYIGLIERQAATDSKFAQMLKNVWRNRMADEVWSRVSAIQCKMGIYYNRGFAFLRTGDADKAIADFTEAIRLDPQRVDNFGGRAMAYEEKGELDKAIADLNEAIRLKPTLARVYHSRELVYEKKGDTAQAEADFAQAKKLGYKTS